MRRSRSSSNIPLPSIRRQSSIENLPSSQLPTLRRSNSSNSLSVKRPSHLQPPRITINDGRLSGAASNRRNTATPLKSVGPGAGGHRISATPSGPGGWAHRVTATPLESKAAGAARRRVTATPLSKANTTPSGGRTNAIVNDKKFSMDQFKKICAFLEGKVDDFDPKCLKPLTLNSFVQTTSILFKEIDSRISIDMTNYKEAVLKYLKLYKYPGLVSMSLLRSVNTSTSWPQVMSIFGWLVDLIYEMSYPSEDNEERYLLGRAHAYYANTSKSEEGTKGLYINLIEEILGSDQEESLRLEVACSVLSQEAEQKRTMTTEKQKKVKILHEKLEEMQTEIREFEESNLEEKIQNELRDLQLEKETIAQKILEVKECNDEKKKLISSQKYSLKDKQQLLKELDDKKYSLSLRKEELKNTIKLKEEQDYKLTNHRRQIETEILRINGSLLQLNKGQFADEIKKIRLPDRGFQSPNFMNELEDKKNSLKNLADQIASAVEEAEQVLSVAEKQNEQSTDNLHQLEKSIENAKGEKQRIVNEISRVLFEFDILEKNHEAKMETLRQQAPDIESLKREKQNFEEKASELREQMKSFEREFKEISKKLVADITENSMQMRNIMTEMTAEALAQFEKRVQRETLIANMLEDTTK